MYILGASQHAKAIIDLLPDKELVKGIYDDNEAVDQLLGIPVSHPIPDRFDDKKETIIAIGNNRDRQKLALKIASKVNFGIVVHHSSILSSHRYIGRGTVVMERAIVKIGAKVGDHVIINTGAQVDHDCVIGNFAHIAPGVILCGAVNIGEGTLVGAATVVLPGVRIGDWCVIGAGSVVHSDVPDGSTWIGSKLKE